MDLLIEDILDLENGKLLNAAEILKNDEEYLFNLRMKLESDYQQQKKNYVCAFCYQYLKLRGGSGTQQILHFAHLKNSDDCPIKSQTKLTKKEILFLQYNGFKESERHIKLKNRLYEIISIDNRFSNQKIEEIVKDNNGRKTWKKPDVQGKYYELLIAFEIQLNTTFLSVIASRDLFYTENNIPIVWLFDNFDTENTKFMEKDIFYNNNSNAFVFDDESYKISKSRESLHLKVFYQKPIENNLSIDTKWKNEIIDFDQMTFNYNKLYYYDYSYNKKKIKYSILKKSIFIFIESFPNKHIDINEFNEYIHDLSNYNLQNWNERKDLKTIRILFCVFHSIKNRQVYGFKYKNIIQLIDYVYQHFNQVYWLLLEFIKSGKHENSILIDDKKNTFKRINQKFKNQQIINETKYTEYMQYFFSEIKQIPK